MRRFSILSAGLIVMVIAAGTQAAAAPKAKSTTKPVEVPAYGWKLKDGAPEWASRPVSQWIAGREGQVPVSASRIADEQAQLAALEAAKIDPKLTTSGGGGLQNGYVFRTAADKAKAVGDRKKSLASAEATLSHVLDPNFVPGVSAKLMSPEHYQATPEVPGNVAVKVIEKIDDTTAVAELYLGASANGQIGGPLKLSKPDAPKLLAWVKSDVLKEVKVGELRSLVLMRSGTRQIQGRGELPAMVQPDLRPWLEPVK